MTAKRSAMPQVIGLVLLYLFCCWVEPCDGHGCDREVKTYVGR
jgi:hypothetical protein